MATTFISPRERELAESIRRQQTLDEAFRLSWVMPCPFKKPKWRPLAERDYPTLQFRVQPATLSA
jgi:hypothetical protein